MNDQLIRTFYTSFQQKDFAGMQRCYHENVVFTDPVFLKLRGNEACAMWHMLLTAAKDLKIEFKNIRAEGFMGSCDWDAWYTFSRTGRQVHNVIHAEFEFKEGKIISHADTFDLTRWAGMALGPAGKLFGWSSFIKSKIRATAAGGLRKFLADHPEYHG